MIPDMINGSMEFISAGIMLLSVRQLYRDKCIAGIALWPTIFFDVFAIWDLYYYPALDQWVSFVATACLVAVNAWWSILAVHYTRRAKRKQIASNLKSEMPR